jgi:RIO kinase 1
VQFELQDDAPFDQPNNSSWDGAAHGPEPRPDWVITDLSAIDSELGVLKTGKEADVHLVRRVAPDGRESLLAAKRYRTSEHRMFDRDAGYQEGRRTKRTRDTRAMARRTTYGRDPLSGKWAGAEFTALADLVANPQGAEFLHRDCENVCTWFARRGHTSVEFEYLFGDLMAEALGAW